MVDTPYTFEEPSERRMRGVIEASWRVARARAFILEAFRFGSNICSIYFLLF